MKSSTSTDMIQNAYVVRDLEESIKEWVELMHAGPFYLMKSGFEVDKLYRGKYYKDTYTNAVGFCGDLIIELFQTTNDEPSIFRELSLGDRRSKLHHMHHVRPLTPSQYEQEIAAFAKSGFGPAYSARIPDGSRATFIDTYQEWGFFIELMESPPTVFRGLDLIKAAHQNWNGVDPIRTENVFGLG